MATITLTTFADLVEAARDYLGANAERGAGRDVRRAVLSAYRELATGHRWSYFYQRGRVTTDASYATGTVAYDHCVTPEHEALTRAGWKRYEQLHVGDEILAYDHDREVCTWQPIQNIHTFDYEGDVLDVRRKGRSVLRCTPNHRVPVFERFGHGHGTPRGVRKRWVLAKDLTPEHTTPLVAPIDQEDGGPLTPRLAAILSWSVTDGYNTFRRWATPRIIQSPTANPEKCREIEALVGSKPFVTTGGCHSYPIYKKDGRALKAVASAKADLVPLFCRFGVQQAEAAIRAMILAEASTHPLNQQKVFSQWGDNKPVAEAFQIACLLAGKAVNISEGTYWCHGFGRDYGERTRYQCPVRHSNGIKLAKLSTWVPYKGKVWCPQVQTGAWVVRCNGAVMITGNSGGAFERLLTLTSGTWPTWAAFGQIRIDNITYQVATRESNSQLTLSINSNPGADVAAGTSYRLYRDSYPLPADFLAMADLMNVSGNMTRLHHVQPADWMDRQRVAPSVAAPREYTILGSPDHFGSMGLALYPPPDDDYQLDFIYQRRPRPLVVESYSTGTVTVSANSATITGSGTTFTSAMVGSVLRLGTTANPPTPLWGAEPYVQERVITGFTSATSLTVDAAIGTAYTGVKYVISDPVDIEEGAMLVALERCIEKQLALGRIMENAGAAVKHYRDALILAREADSRSFAEDWSGRARYWPTLRDMPRGSDLS